MTSIRRDLALRTGLTSILILLSGGLGLYLSLRKAFKLQFDQTLVTKAQALITASEIQNGKFEIDLDVQAFAGFGSLAPGDYFEIFTRDGKTLERSPSLGLRHLTRPADFAGAEEGFADLILPDGVHGRAHWQAYLPGVDDDRLDPPPPPHLKILVASDDDNLKRTSRLIALFLAIFGLGSIFASLLVLNAVVRSGLKPLERLSSDVQSINVSQLDRRLSVTGLPQELTGVAAKLNELLHRLEASFRREKRFTSDAAHELRTPLAELRAMTELGTRWPDEFTADHGGEMLEVLSELEALLETLTLLAKAESGSLAAKCPLDLEATIREQLDSVQKIAVEREITFALAFEEGEFSCDPVLWRAILQNLLNNAVTYSPRGSVVRVSASPSSLRVENEAPDLTADDLEHLFDRFWRKSASRSEKNHSGLGLSVVRAAVEFLGGRTFATLKAGSLRLEIRW